MNLDVPVEVARFLLCDCKRSRTVANELRRQGPRAWRKPNRIVASLLRSSIAASRLFTVEYAFTHFQASLTLSSSLAVIFVTGL